MTVARLSTQLRMKPSGKNARHRPKRVFYISSLNLVCAIKRTSCLWLRYNREFEKLLQRKHHLKIELSRRLSVLGLFMLVRNGRTLSFHLSSTYGFHIKAENERFTAARAARLFFSRSTNHIIDVTRCCCCRFVNSLM